MHFCIPPYSLYRKLLYIIFFFGKILALKSTFSTLLLIINKLTILNQHKQGILITQKVLKIRLFDEYYTVQKMSK